MTNFTAYVGKQKRWIEIRPLYKHRYGKCPELSDEFIIYSNDRRTSIGELQQEANQDNSILGSFFYSLESNIAEFKGKETLRADEITGMRDVIKAALLFHYARCTGTPGFSLQMV